MNSFGQAAQATFVQGKCPCTHCSNGRDALLEPTDPNRTSWMIVCPTCGYKRCPKAIHHDNKCTGSNEANQVESRLLPAEQQALIEEVPANAIFYHKLVRDNMEKVIQKHGHRAKFDVIPKERLIPHLLMKLQEELNELRQKISPDEIADIAEVLSCLAYLSGIEASDVQKVSERKRRSRGSFLQGVYLVWSEPPVGDPDSDWKGKVAE